jgi:hypothetical protein
MTADFKDFTNAPPFPDGCNQSMKRSGGEREKHLRSFGKKKMGR